VVRDLTEKVKEDVIHRRPQSPSEMLKLLDLQRGLGHAANNLTSTASSRSTHEMDAGQDMLDSYFSIVDIVIGDQSVDAWKQEVRLMHRSNTVNLLFGTTML